MPAPTHYWKDPDRLQGPAQATGHPHSRCRAASIGLDGGPLASRTGQGTVPKRASPFGRGFSDNSQTGQGGSRNQWTRAACDQAQGPRDSNRTYTVLQRASPTWSLRSTLPAQEPAIRSKVTISDPDIWHRICKQAGTTGHQRHHRCSSWVLRPLDNGGSSAVSDTTSSDAANWSATRRRRHRFARGGAFMSGTGTFSSAVTLIQRNRRHVTRSIMPHGHGF